MRKFVKPSLILKCKIDETERTRIKIANMAYFIGTVRFFFEYNGASSKYNSYGNSSRF